MTLLVFLFQASRKLLVAALLASLVSGFGSAALVALINRALTSDGRELTRLGWQFAGVCLLVLLTRWLSQALFVHLSQRTLASLRLYISQELAKAPYRHIETQGSARMFALLTDDVHTVADLFMTLPNFTMHGAVVVGCLLYVAMLSWQVFLFALVLTVVGAAVYHRAHVRALEHLRASRLEQDQLFQHFRALHDGAKELKLHRERRRAFFSELLGTSIDRVRTQHTKGMLTYVAAESWGSFLFFGFIGAVLFVFSRWFATSPAVLSGYALVFLHMVLPMEALLLAIPNVNRARVALERIQSGIGTALDREAHAADIAEAPSGARRLFQSLELRDLTHSYRREMEDGSFQLGPINAVLGPGQVVFLIGGNGSGKTTLAKLLVGLYAPEGGSILLDGVPVTDANREDYRQCFSAVFSDFFLFERLIGLRRPELDTEARGWLIELGLDHKVKVQDGKFSTTELSQGQRKRLALLVAYLEDRPLYLFDEWAADQDPLYKEVFYKRLLPELRARGKTVVAVTHDDRYFYLADRCIKLEFGQAVAGDAQASFKGVAAGEAPAALGLASELVAAR